MLRKLQENFRDYILKGKYAYSFAKNIQENGISGTARLDIYKNNVFANATNALQEIYPKVLTWVGEEYFKNLCQHYIKKYPPTSGIFIEYGESFGSYITKREELKNFPFLTDLAKLEWIIHQSHHAKPEHGITAQECSAKMEEENFTLRVRTDVFLLKSKYNIIDIFEEKEPLPNESYVLISRNNFVVTYTTITKAEYNVLQNLNELKESENNAAILANYLNSGLLYATNS